MRAAQERDLNVEAPRQDLGARKGREVWGWILTRRTCPAPGGAQSWGPPGTPGDAAVPSLPVRRARAAASRCRRCPRRWHARRPRVVMATWLLPRSPCGSAALFLTPVPTKIEAVGNRETDGSGEAGGRPGAAPIAPSAARVGGTAGDPRCGTVPPGLVAGEINPRCPGAGAGCRVLGGSHFLEPGL